MVERQQRLLAMLGVTEWHIAQAVKGFRVAVLI